MNKQQAKKKPCNYTIMLIPHSGQGVKQLHIPPVIIKGLGILAASFILISMSMFYHYTSMVHRTLAEREELSHLRETNNVQVGQIQQLAQVTRTLQEDMQRMNKLDDEIRKMVGGEVKEAAPVSRNNVMRSGVYIPGASIGGPGRGPNLQQLVRGVEQLRQEMIIREASLTTLRDTIAAKQARQAAMPTMWPGSGEITSGFGYRSSPWGWSREFHSGIDIANSWGTPIFATADGVVIFSGWDGGYGKIVIIDHGNGIQTAYAHNSAIHVTVGQHVSKGGLIADMGSTGASTGPHVHYEVRVNGERVNPLDYMS
jgi:murein DD-endopeptidase MepM/ murein hydrolase activator NlpD